MNFYWEALPSMHRPSADVNFCDIKCLPHAIKSVIVFFFFKYFPSSYHILPKSPPILKKQINYNNKE